MARLKGVAAGAGYFSRYHYEAWSRIPEVELAALYNRTPAKAEELRAKFGIARAYADFEEMLDRERRPTTRREPRPPLRARVQRLTSAKPRITRRSSKWMK